MSRAWQRQRERGSPSALRLIYWISTRLNRRVSRALLYPIVLYFLITGGAARRGSADYLRRVFGRAPHWWEVFRHIHCFACTILDRVFLLAGQFERFEVRVHNGEALLQRVRAGQGALLLGSHLGSFEILRVLAVSATQLRIKILMASGHNSALTEFLDALNTDIAATVIPTGHPDTLLRAQEALQQGYMIGTLGDRVAADDKRVRCQFLGASADFPTGPMLLAAALHCPVVLFFGLYLGANRYEVYFEPFAEHITLDRRQRQQELSGWMQRYADALACHARRTPYNWFNFYDFWAETEVRG